MESQSQPQLHTQYHHQQQQQQQQQQTPQHHRQQGAPLPEPRPGTRRVRQSSSNFSLAFPRSASLLGPVPQLKQSRTWTPSSGGFGLLNDADDVQDRSTFVEEYNRLATKHGVRALNFDDFVALQGAARSPEKRSWFHRLFRVSFIQQTPIRSAALQRPRHRRSVSDLGHLMLYRREPPKQIDLQTMVRLSGKSVLYLPQDYAPCSLILPTCIRATAQYIAQHTSTRGIFRIPGSVKIVNSLFEYYCYVGGDGVDVAGTVCCATLPTHIQYSVHDVGSTFKRLLSVLPGGILGSLTVFDAFVAIHARLQGEPEFPRTKQTKVRARLIALAIGTIESQFRRELICAVFGLLSLIGRVAEVAPREDAEGRPLPTADLMGYNALGIIFGPLLMGDLLEKYATKRAAPYPSLLQFPISPRKRCRDRQKQKSDGTSSEPPPVNRIIIANDIAEMLITNWRDIVRQMKSLGIHYRRESSSARLLHGHNHPSNSESFIIKMPPELKEAHSREDQFVAGQDHSPDPETPTQALNRRRSRPVRRDVSGNRALQSHTHLVSDPQHAMQRKNSYPNDNHYNHGYAPIDYGKGNPRGRNTHHDGGFGGSPFPLRTHSDRRAATHVDEAKAINPSQSSHQDWSRHHPAAEHSPVSLQQIPPRGSSKRGLPAKPIIASPALSSSEDENAGVLARPRDSFSTLLHNVREAHSVDQDLPAGRETIRSQRSLENNEQIRQQSGSDTCHCDSSPETPDAVISGKIPSSSHLRGEGDRQVGHAPSVIQMSGALHPPSVRSGFQDWPTVAAESGNQGPEGGTVRSATSTHLVPSSAAPLSHALAPHQPAHDIVPDHHLNHVQDTSEIESEHSDDSQAPIKRRSVRAMAAMFESQQLLQRLNKSRRRPPGGVDLSPPRRRSKDALEHSHSLPILASRDADGAGWARSGESDVGRTPADIERGQAPAALPIESRERHECLEEVDRCTSACANHSLDLKYQIVHLERLLNTKSDEVEMLKRRLEMVGSGNSPNEQLKQANKELSVLQEKAEATEKKMRLFERFTSRLRGIRDSMVTESSRQSSMNRLSEQAAADGGVHGRPAGGPGGAELQYLQRVRFAEGSEGRDSDDSGMMADEAMVPARIRNCLHYEGGTSASVGGRGRYGMAGKADNAQVQGLAQEQVQGHHGHSGFGAKQHLDDDVGGLAQVWSAVEELLKMDDQTFLKDWSPGALRAQDAAGR